MADNNPQPVNPAAETSGDGSSTSGTSNAQGSAGSSSGSGILGTGINPGLQALQLIAAPLDAFFASLQQPNVTQVQAMANAVALAGAFAPVLPQLESVGFNDVGLIGQTTLSQALKSAANASTAAAPAAKPTVKKK